MLPTGKTTKQGKRVILPPLPTPREPVPLRCPALVHRRAAGEVPPAMLRRAALGLFLAPLHHAVNPALSGPCPEALRGVCPEDGCPEELLPNGHSR